MRYISLRFLVAGAVPALSIAGALAGYRLLRNLLASPSIASVTDWAQIFIVLLSILVSGMIGLWWASSYLHFLAQLILFKFKIRSNIPHLPRWAPSVLKVLVSGSITASLLVGPQAAHAVTRTDNGPYINQAVAKQPTPLLSSSTSTESTLSHSEDRIIAAPKANPSLHAVSPLFEASTNIAQDSITPVNSQHGQTISPLFGRAPNQAQEDISSELDENKPAKPPTFSLYRVKPGDSLWLIAENYLPPQASGAEVLNLMSKIQDLNSEAIPTLETVIFPGQQIKLPL